MSVSRKLSGWIAANLALLAGVAGATPLSEGPTDVRPGDAFCKEQGPLPTHPLTLDEVTALAICHSASISAAQAQVRHQSAQVRVARAPAYPQVSASTSRVADRTSFSGAEPGTRLRSTSFTAGASWRAYDFGARSYAVAAEEHARLASLAGADDVRDAVVQDTTAAFFDRQRMEALALLKEEEVALAQDALDGVNRKVVSGVGSEFERLQALTFLGRMMLERRLATANVEKARSTLASLLEQSAPFAISDQPLDALEPDLAFGEGVQDALIEGNAAVQAARAQLEAARQRVRQARAESKPTVDTSIDYYRNGRPAVGLSSVRASERVASISLTIPLFDGFRGSALIDQAAALVDQRQAELAQARSRVALDTRHMVDDILSATDALSISSSTVKSAEDAYASARRRFQHGVADLSELIAAQTGLVSAREARVDARTSLSLAVARIRSARK
ncbi:TolC family protein [Roseateles noduli]|uniref:TolC family protein n=1 Tax=Roseateles noduli TaxID=2052484 RepID=UPI003D655674